MIADKVWQRNPRSLMNTFTEREWGTGKENLIPKIK